MRCICVLSLVERGGDQGLDLGLDLTSQFVRCTIELRRQLLEFRLDPPQALGILVGRNATLFQAQQRKRRSTAAPFQLEPYGANSREVVCPVFV
jgi:hypothetical protein